MRKITLNTNNRVRTLKGVKDVLMEDTTTQTSAPEVAVPTETPVNDTPSLSESIQSAISETNAQTETPAPEPTDPGKYVPGQNPQLDEVYRSMQADYTRKTQEIAQERERIAQETARFQQAQALLNGQNPQQTEQVNPVIEGITRQLKEAGYSDEAIEMGKMVANSLLEHNQQQEQARVQAEQARQFEEKTLSSIDEAGQLDPRLNDTNLVYDLGDGEKTTFGQMVEQLVAADQNWMQDPKAAIQKAIKKVDGLINAAKQQGKEELSTQATKKAQTYKPVQTSPQGAVDTDQEFDLRGAINAAREQVGI